MKRFQILASALLVTYSILSAQEAKVEPFGLLDVIRVAETDAAKLRELQQASDKAQAALENYRKEVSQKLEDAWQDDETKRIRLESGSSITLFTINLGTVVSGQFVFNKDFRFARHERVFTDMGYGDLTGVRYNCTVPKISADVQEITPAEAREGRDLKHAKEEADHRYDAWELSLGKKYKLEGPLTFSDDFSLVMKPDERISAPCPRGL